MKDQAKNSVRIFDKYAKEYAAKFGDVSIYKNSFDVFLSRLQALNSKVLELGCGPGNVTAYLLQQKPGLKITGIDLSSSMLAIAVENNPRAEFIEMDVRDIRTLNSQYDGIIAAFCLPYLTRDEAAVLIEDASSMLATDGVLYLSTMEDDNAQSGWHTSSKGDQMFIHYHEGEYLQQMLMQSGLELVYSDRINNVMGEKQVTDLVMVAIKK
jgi:trans-aconitate methyltransferase